MNTFTVSFDNESDLAFARYIANEYSGPHGVGNWLHDLAVEKMANHPLTRMCLNLDCRHVMNPVFEEVDGKLVAIPLERCPKCGCAVRPVEDANYAATLLADYDARAEQREAAILRFAIQ